MATPWTVYAVTAAFVFVVGTVISLGTTARRNERLKQAAYQRLERKVLITEALG